MTKTPNRVLALVLTIAALMTGQRAWAENGWDIQASTSNNVTTFTITRTNTAVAETVYYRLVNLSAYAGQHYKVTNVNGTPIAAAQQTQALSGTFTFTAGDTDSRTIQVTEQTATTNAYKYQTGTERSYKLEVTEIGGFFLTSSTRSFTTGTQFTDTYLNKSITDLVYFQNGSVKSGSGNKYLDVAHSGTNGTEKMIDDGYDYNDNTLCTVSTSTLYNNNSNLRSWLNSLNYKMYATVYFQQREVNDGYQYIQILADNASTYDGKDPDGDVNTPSTSLYKAAFILTKTEDVCTSWKYQLFPHRYDYYYSPTECEYSDTYLYNQLFKSSDYRATNSGSLVLNPTVNDINVRFDANGSGEDTWYLRNLKVRLALVDANAPTKLAVSVAPGRHSKGNTVYVSVTFDEIVKVTGTPKLTTENNWGDLSYVAGDGTNVLTFMRTIPANASGNLNITGLSGTVKDLAGNDLVGSSVTATNICSLDDSYAYSITYNLNEGSVATENPTSYTWETATFTLNNPTKTGYVFNGWTGSNSNTPSTSVTIANHSHGNKSYTANWTQVWTGSGAQGNPYIINSTQGLDLLAQYVNSGNNCSTLYFQLGGPIEYTHTTDWNSSSSEENNYTAIGTESNPFQGTFDGNNNTISGIRIYKGNDNYQGLFGKVGSGGTVKRVTLSDARITGYDMIGGIVGRSDNATIEDCTIDADVCIHAVVNNSSHHGGIVGSNKSGTVRRCISRAHLTVKNDVSGNRFGGIAGYNSGAIQYSIADGAIIPDVNGRGAIVGFNLNSYNTQNYYHACTVAGVANATGVGRGYDGSTTTTDPYYANALYAITLGPNVTLVRNGTNLPGTNNRIYTNGATIGGTEYYIYNATISLGYSGEVSTGYHVEYSATAGTINGSTLTMPAEAVTVTATVPANSYTVHFNKNHNDATGTMDDQAFTYDEAQDLTTNAFTGPTGYVFNGWNTQADGNGASYTNQQEVSNLTATQNGVFELYAKWTAITYTLTYELAGGSVATPNPENYTIESGDITLVNPTRTGYTFAGWTGTGLAEATQTVTITTGSYGDKSYTATWTPITYSVRFNKNHNDATGTMDDQAFTYDEAQDLTTNAFTRIGYTFTGWNTKSNGSGNAYTDEQEVSNLTATQGDVINLYAQWHFLDGSGTADDPYLIHNSGELLKLAARTANGTQFTNEYFQLEADIDMDGITWDGIGGEFRGIFDGAGHTISNVTINRPDDRDVGLFNYIRNHNNSTVVKNLILDGATIIGKNQVGALVGTEASTPTIENCVVLNANVTATTTSGTQGGIIAGYNDFTGTNNYYYNCSLTIGGETRTSNIGAASSDRDNAKGIYRLTLGSEIALNEARTSVKVLNGDITLYADGATIDGKEYYTAGTSITVELSGGYIGVSVNSTAATDNDNGTYTFTMPAEDATVGGFASGYCGMASVNSGHNVIWTYEGSTTTLTISPNPDVSEQTDFRMANYGESNQPWNDYKGALTTLVIDAGVTSIGGYACYNCTSLTAITQPDGLTTIGYYAFWGCSSLTAITIPNSVTSIGVQAFRGCSKLESMNIPNGVTTINSGTFWSCSSLENINIPTGVTSIGNNAFMHCSKLESITLPTNVTSIGFNAFYGCSKLESITIPANVTSIGEYAFIGCDKLATIIVLPVTPPAIENNNLGSFGSKATGKNVYFRNPAYMDNAGWSAVVNGYELGYALVDNGENNIAAIAQAGGSPNIMLYGRTLYRDGDWNTLCLPFDIGGDKIPYSTLCDATIMYFDWRYWYDADGNDHYNYEDGYHRSGEVENGNLRLYFYGTQQIDAGYPYILKWGTKADHPATDIVNPVFQGVTVTSTTPIDVTTEVGPGNVTFRGTYSPIDYAADNHSILFVGMNNSLYWPQKGAHLGAFRAYFELGNGITVGEANSSVRSFNLEFSEDNGDATRLNDSVKMINDNEADAWYTLDGVKLDSKPTRKGLYIYGGRKVVIK